MTTEFLRPISDTNVGTWTTAPLWSKINDQSDGTEIQSSTDNPSTCEVRLAAPSGVDTGQPFIVRYRWRVVSGSTTTDTFVVRLMDGTTEIQSWSTSDASPELTTTSQTVTNALPSDFSNLRLQFERAGGGNPGARRTIGVVNAEVEYTAAAVGEEHSASSSLGVSVDVTGAADKTESQSATSSVSVDLNISGTADKTVGPTSSASVSLDVSGTANKTEDALPPKLLAASAAEHDNDTFNIAIEAGQRLVCVSWNRSGATSFSVSPDAGGGTWETRIAVITMSGDSTQRRAVAIADIAPTSNVAAQTYTAAWNEGPAGCVWMLVAQGEEYDFIGAVGDDSGTNQVTTQPAGTVNSVPPGDRLVISALVTKNTTDATAAPGWETVDPGWLLAELEPELDGGGSALLTNALGAHEGTWFNAGAGGYGAELDDPNGNLYEEFGETSHARGLSAAVAIFVRESEAVRAASTSLGVDIGVSATASKRVDSGAELDLTTALSAVSEKTISSSASAAVDLTAPSALAEKSGATDTNVSASVAISSTSEKSGVADSEVNIDLSVAGAADASAEGAASSAISIDVGVGAESEKTGKSESSLDVNLSSSGNVEKHGANDSEFAVNLEVSGDTESLEKRSASTSISVTASVDYSATKHANSVSTSTVELNQLMEAEKQSSVSSILDVELTVSAIGDSAQQSEAVTSLDTTLDFEVLSTKNAKSSTSLAVEVAVDGESAKSASSSTAQSVEVGISGSIFVEPEHKDITIQLQTVNHSGDFVKEGFVGVSDPEFGDVTSVEAVSGDSRLDTVIFVGVRSMPTDVLMAEIPTDCVFADPEIDVTTRKDTVDSVSVFDSWIQEVSF